MLVGLLFCAAVVGDQLFRRRAARQRLHPGQGRQAGADRRLAGSPANADAFGAAQQRNRRPHRRLSGLNLGPLAETYARGDLQEAVMTHWHDTMVDRPETDGAVYATGWTISGLAVLGDHCRGLGARDLAPGDFRAPGCYRRRSPMGPCRLDGPRTPAPRSSRTKTRYLCWTRPPPVTSSPSRRPIKRPSTTSRHQTGKKNSGQDSGVLRFGLQQPFDDADGANSPIAPPAEAGEEHDQLPGSHRAAIRKSRSRKPDGL